MKPFEFRTRWCPSIVLHFIVLMTATGVSSCSSKNEDRSSFWALHDSTTSNPTSFDPIHITDAFTTTLLANVYEGLVRLNPEGTIVPGIAERWDIEADGRLWRFKLRPSIKYHGAALSAADEAGIEADDVVYSLTRCVTDPSSLHSWLFIDLVKGASEAKAAGPGSPVAGLRAIDKRTVEVELLHPFPLLDRLVMSGAWIYPRALVESRKEKAFDQGSIGTGPYQIVKFVTDDHIQLGSFDRYWGGVTSGAPSSVIIHVEPDPLSAVEAFRRGDLDIVQLELETLSKGQSLEKDGTASILTVTANELDYLVLHLDIPPFDDIRIRKAINMAVDRAGLVAVLSGIGEPALGFLPPCSRSYRGREAIAAAGFREDLEEAKRLVNEYLQDHNAAELKFELTMDAGGLPETIGQFVQSRLQRIPNVHVSLAKQTWPELLQSAFTGKLVFYRFWWNVVTPGEDVYFLFYMPGQEPPKGFNFSFYGSKDFTNLFSHAFSALDERVRTKEVQLLEDKLIADAVAVPLFHRKFAFLVRKGLKFPINQYLARPYQAARR